MSIIEPSIGYCFLLDCIIAAYAVARSCHWPPIDFVSEEEKR